MSFRYSGAYKWDHTASLCYLVLGLSWDKIWNSQVISHQKFTNILPTLLHPACLEWQGQEFGDDNMAAVISSTAVPRSRAAWSRGCFPGGHDPCLKGGSVGQSEGCWSLAALPTRIHAALFLLTDNRGGKRHDQATHHLRLDMVRRARVRERN